MISYLSQHLTCKKITRTDNITNGTSKFILPIMINTASTISFYTDMLLTSIFTNFVVSILRSILGRMTKILIEN